ncbi:hypothetical protein COLO4_01657 [Corchorus olitorius]|uniref:Uncharacterized protein n=1 Tax=Corchorus olitorius TaxID=93759 RepID=A0A1R3L267_9ROSI|nr:hypothetical protein COLO4_01657 [Corchorus olitorius]
MLAEGDQVAQQTRRLQCQPLFVIDHHGAPVRLTGDRAIRLEQVAVKPLTIPGSTHAQQIRLRVGVAIQADIQLIDALAIGALHTARRPVVQRHQADTDGTARSGAQVPDQHGFDFGQAGERRLVQGIEVELEGLGLDDVRRIGGNGEFADGHHRLAGRQQPGQLVAGPDVHAAKRQALPVQPQLRPLGRPRDRISSSGAYWLTYSVLLPRGDCSTLCMTLRHSMTHAAPAHEQTDADQIKHDHGDQHEGNRHPDADVGHPEDAVAEGVDHVQDRIDQGHLLPEGRQQIDGIEDPAQVGQGRQHEGRHDGDVVEVARVNGVDETAQGEDRRGEDDHQQHDAQVMHLHVGKEQRQHADDGGHGQATQDAAHGIADEDDVGRHRRDQQFFHRALELAAEEAGDHVAVGVGDHRHHDQARHDVLHVGEATHAADAIADQVTEDHEVQDHGDRRGQQRLRPDAGEAAHFAMDDGPQRHQVGLEFGTHRATLARFFSTRETNSSSRRLALFLRLCTWMPAASSWRNRALTPLALSMATSKE